MYFDWLLSRFWQRYYTFHSVLSTSTTPRVSTTTAETTLVTSTTKTTSTTSRSTVTTTRVSTTTFKPKPLCDDIDYYELNDPNRNVNLETHSNGWCDVSGSGNCQRDDKLGMYLTLRTFIL